MSDIMADFAKKARDHARIPMQVDRPNMYTSAPSADHRVVGFKRARWVHDRYAMDAG